MLIGITGGIGSGKSVISNELRRMGYEVYNTDHEAKRIIVEDPSVRLQIESILGSDVYKDGIYQTSLVAQRAFTNKALLSQLNAIVHPAVKADILSRYSSNQSEITFIECAILYTAGLDQICDKVIAITAPEHIRLERTISRDNSTIEKVQARMRAQRVEEDLQRVDTIINNDGSVSIQELCREIINSL